MHRGLQRAVGLPGAITKFWELALVQTCGIHLLRNTFRYASRCCWDEMSRELRPVCAAAIEAAAQQRFDEFVTNWGPRYPATVRLWRSAWSGFVPFLDYDPEIRRVICSINAIESINATYRRAIRARGHSPNEQAGIKCLYLATRALHPGQEDHDGQQGGSLHSTNSPSRSKAGSPRVRTKPMHQNRIHRNN